MKRNALLLAAAALVVGLIAAGCGGNDDESSDTGTEAVALTKEEFLQKGNAICEAGNKELDAAGKAAFGDVPEGQQPPADEVEAFTNDTLAPTVQKQIDDIRALGAPSGDEDQVNAILDAAQAALDKVKADPSLLFGEGSTDPFAEANQMAKAYGLTVCAG